MSRIFNRHIQIPACSKCEGTGWKFDRNHEIERDKKGAGIHCDCYFNNLYLDANIGMDYWTVTPESFEGSENDLKQITKHFKRIEKLKESGQGLYIYGRNGVGKTTLGILLLKHVLQHTKYSAMFVPFSDLVILNSRIISGFYDKEAGGAIDVIKNKDFLMIDDIGKEYDDGKDKARATLNSILRYRDMWKKPTLYTANSDIKSLQTHYGEGNYTIIYGRSIAVEMENQIDFRKRRKARLSIPTEISI